jgi:hypothetical protein
MSLLLCNVDMIIACMQAAKNLSFLRRTSLSEKFIIASPIVFD